MKLMTLSHDLIETIEKLLQNNDLAKLLYYNTAKPLDETNIEPSMIAPFGKYERILPYPFDVEFREDVRSQLHIYFPQLEFQNNMIVENAVIFLDIIVHKDLWTMRDQENRKVIRPYLIAQEVIHLLVDDIYFIEMTHISVNEDFFAIRLQGKIINWNDKHAREY